MSSQNQGSICRVLTFWEPWATLVMEGFKLFEFRSWEPPASLVGHRMGVHAGAKRGIKQIETDIRGLIYALDRGGRHARATGLDESRAAECVSFLEKLLHAPRALPASELLGTVKLGPPLHGEALTAKLDLAFDPANTHWGWPLSDPKRFSHPIPIAGQQFIWDWNDLRRLTAAHAE